MEGEVQRCPGQPHRPRLQCGESVVVWFSRVNSLLHHKQLEAALKDHLQASAGNALDLQFSNKIYAPK